MLHVESLVDGVSQFAACTEHRLALVCGYFGKSRRAVCAGGAFDGFRHHRGQKARPEPESLIETNVFLAMRKIKKTSVLCSPLVEKLHDGFHQTLANASIPEVRANR